jgi:glyoxylase-like metal-dependent hydrolase (beta-lactamase superfamily II)
LLTALAEHGVRRTDIDTVFLTHVHVDHIGWNTEFGTARFLCHPAAVEAARERADRPHIQRCVLPLVEAGRVEKVVDGTEVAPGVVAVELAGHDAGHTGLRIGSEAILVADSFPHPAFLDQPDWAFIADSDAAQCQKTRRTLLNEVTDTEKLLICSHYPGSGIGLVTREGGLVVWKEAA